MGKKIALGIGVVVLALAAVISMQPSSFTIERSAVIDAPAELVFAHIQDLRAMDAWSPWVKMDPGMQIAYEGPEAGVGARSSWEGPQIGKGRLTITAVTPAQEVEMRLEMLEPMQGTNRVRFILVPAGSATKVTWRMDGTNGFGAKAIGLVMNMDEMVGGPFESGLASLAAVAEAHAHAGR